MLIATASLSERTSTHSSGSDASISKLFVSGYTNKEQPNIWDRSAEVRAAS